MSYWSVGGQRGHTGDIIEGANLGHVRQAQYEFVFDGHSSSNETGVSPLRHNADSPPVTPLDDLADLVCGARLEDSCGLAMVLVHPVIVEWFELGRWDGTGR